MADETRSVELAIDNSKAIKALADLRKAQNDLAKSAAKGDIEFDKAAKSLSKLKKQETDLIKVTRALDDSFEREEKQIKKTTRAVEEQAQSFGQLADARRKSIEEGGAGAAGDVASQAAGLRGAAATFGGDSLGGGFEVVEGIADIAEFGPQAAGSLKSMGEGINLASKSATGIVAPLAGLATSAGAAVAPLVGGSVALGTIAAVALPLVVIGAALGAVFKVASDHAKELTESTRRQFEASVEVNDLLRDSTTTSEDFRAARAAANADFEQAQAALTIAQDEYNKVIEEGGILTTLISPREEELNRIIKEQETLVLTAGTRLAEYNEHVFDSSLATADAADAEEALAEERLESIAKLEVAATSATQSTDRALQASEQASEQLNSALADRAQSQADAAQLSALEAKFADEDQVAQEKEHRTNLSNIATQGQARLESLQEGFGALATERNKSLQGIETKGSDKINKARGAFFSKQISATRKFQSDTAKIETDTAKKRTKLLDDLNDRLSDASRDNNVIAFLEAQREGNKALAEDAINAQDAEKQRIQEFAQQREQERQIFEQKQAETLAAIEAEKIKVIEAFGERQIALAKQIDAEKIAIEQRIALEEKRFADQEAREAQQAERTRRRAELRQRQEERDFNARMSALRQESDRRQQIHQQEMSALSAIQTQIAQLQAAASSPASGGTSGRRFGGSQSSPFINSASRFGQRRPNSSSSSSRIQPFHDGGVIDFASGQSEGFALVKAGEIVLNPDTLAKKGGSGLPLTGGNANGVGGSSMQVTIQDNRTLQIGDIATVAAVSSAIDRSNKAMVNNIHKMVEGATA